MTRGDAAASGIRLIADQQSAGPAAGISPRADTVGTPMGGKYVGAGRRWPSRLHAAARQVIVAARAGARRRTIL
jgi:hypothetical protein